MNRRTLLTSLSILPASASAGCTSLGRELFGTDDAETPDPLFLQNDVDEVHVLTVAVTQPATETTLIEGAFRLPGRHFVRFPEIGVTGETYTIRASIVDEASVEQRWMPDPCSAVTGQAAVIRVTSSGLRYDQNGCDVYTQQPSFELSPEEAAVNNSGSE